MEKINGFVLNNVKYNDRRQIVDIYTDTRGRVSFVMPLSVRLSPLCFLEFDADVRQNKTLQTIPASTSVKVNMLYGLRMNPVKSVLSVFLAEFLSNVLKESVESNLMYEYIKDSLLWLDAAESKFANFHIVFLLRLSRFIGIYPNIDGYNPNFYFDLVDCCYRYVRPPHSHFLYPEEAKTLPYLLHMNYANMHLYGFSRNQRYRCLAILNEFYSIHLQWYKPLKSLDVLHELFD